MMKTILSTFLMALLVGLTGCQSGPASKSDSTGKAYDVLVIMPDTLWMGPAGDTLQAILAENPMILPQQEPLHTVVHIDPQQANKLLLKARNLILFQAGGQAQPSMTVEYDVYAKPQAVVRIAGPSAAAMTEYMSANRFALQGIFDIAERNRTAEGAFQFADREIRDTIRSRFGLHIDIPRGYRIRSQRPNFICVMYDTPISTQGILIYKYPATGPESFSPDSLIANRNRFVSNIEGPNTGSYMRTAPVVDPVFAKRAIHDRQWLVLSGLWDLENGFMGGPFQNYSTYNATTGDMVAVDLYVYSPKYDKRNYLKFLEGIMHTSRILGDSVGTAHRVDTLSSPADSLK
jgi:hypothetical protein